jgi:hypothetical protein
LLYFVAFPIFIAAALWWLPSESWRKRELHHRWARDW